ncbi:type IV toxin-antitoxin system AbiEi family antitoxin domain-containing protein [bacterium]|nr:type IV toxin-antitoxin system AbiEi family antitoxin domain-containing protein [bacterium]
MKNGNTYDKAIEVFQSQGGILRISEAISLGINPKTIYVLLEQGIIKKIHRGLYKLTNTPDLSNPDLVIAAKKIPDSVVCLISALHYHKITTQIPHFIDLALPHGHHHPKIDYPPIRIFRFSESSFTAGIKIFKEEETDIKVYEPAKAIADCFKFRNKIGLDVAIEALKIAYKDKKAKPADILKYARICRIEKIIMPYLETLI